MFQEGTCAEIRSPALTIWSPSWNLKFIKEGSSYISITTWDAERRRLGVRYPVLPHAWKTGAGVASKGRSRLKSASQRRPELPFSGNTCKMIPMRISERNVILHHRSTRLWNKDNTKGRLHELEFLIKTPFKAYKKADKATTDNSLYFLK